MGPTPEELKAQLKELMQIPENFVCLDCNDKRPMWASLIVPPPGAPFPTIGCFCCYQCSGAHRRMGTHICFVRSTNLDEWKEKELLAMQLGGNKLINAIFEANLTKSQKDAVKPTNETEMETRANFIFEKYQHRKYYNLAAYNTMAKQTAAKSPSRSEKSGIGKSSSSAPDLDFPDLSVGRPTQRADSVFLEDFVKDRDTDWWKMNASEKAKPDTFHRSHSSSEANEIEFNPNSSYTSSRRGSQSFSEDEPRGSRFPKRDSQLAQKRQSKNLLLTLQRMESKSRLLDDIKHMEIDQDDPAPMAKPSRTSASSAARRRDTRASTRKKASFDEEKSSTADSSTYKDRRPQAPSRSKNADIPESPSESRRASRRPSGDPDSAPDVSAARERRRQVGRSKSSSSPSVGDLRKTTSGGLDRRRDDSDQKPPSARNMISDDANSSSRRTGSRRIPEDSSSGSGAGGTDDDGFGGLTRLATGSEHTTNSNASSRRPRRGVARTKSMDSDTEITRPRARGTSTTRTQRRPPRATNSSGELRYPRGHESLGELGRQADASMSELSTRSSDDQKPSSRGSGRRSPRTDDDNTPSSSRTGRSRTNDDSGRGARGTSVGSKTARDRRKASAKSNSPAPPTRPTRRGSNPGSRTPSPPSNSDARERRRRDSRTRSPSDAIPPRPSTKSPRPNKASAAAGRSEMEELGRLLSGS